MNKQVIGAVVVIGAAGVVTAWTKKQPITRTILGAYVLLLLLSLLDLFGGSVSRLASAIALIAALYVILNELPWSTLIGLVQGKSTTTSSK